jgi:ketosteroid isomerase-like protein
VPGQEEQAAELLVRCFYAHFNARDVDAMMAAMTDDCVLESGGPPPDGTRDQGQVAVRRYWEDLFRAVPGLMVEIEDMYATGDRCTCQWVLRWVDTGGSAQHLRGIDSWRIRDGRIAEKLTYIKGNV